MTSPGMHWRGSKVVVLESAAKDEIAHCRDGALLTLSIRRRGADRGLHLVEIMARHPIGFEELIGLAHILLAKSKVEDLPRFRDRGDVNQVPKRAVGLEHTADWVILM
jgi:hypothetical protein